MSTLKYDTRASIVKALCIILMVVGHAGAPKHMGEFIYNFHMPAFFFVSGYLFKEKYLDNIVNFVTRRVKSLWWPFVKWSLIFAILHNLFAYFHLYDNIYSLSDYKTKIFQIFTMTGSERLLGGFWFLKELLYASVISCFALKLLHLVSERIINKSGGVLTIVFVFLALAYLLSIAPFKIPTIGSITMLATSFYLAGYWFHNQEWFAKNSWIVGTLGLLLLFFMTYFFAGSMDVKSEKILPFYLLAILGTVSLFKISGCIKGKMVKYLDYVGDKTLYILIFHFLSFKLISLVVILVNDLPIERLSDFPVIGGINNYNWIFYSFAGVLFPLLIWECSNYIQNIRLKK